MIRKYYDIEDWEGGYPGEEEIWKDVFGYENYYQISTKGNIKSKDRVISRSGKLLLKEVKI